MKTYKPDEATLVRQTRQGEHTSPVSLARPDTVAQLRRQSLADESSRVFVQCKANDTGLPDTLKAGIEAMSGISMDRVKVHYNSSRPVQLNAHAYASGSDIHLGPGQEKYLPHEAWHVVQQAQGRVKPTMRMKSSDGAPINDNVEFEREADLMGGRASDFGELVKSAEPDISERTTSSLLSEVRATGEIVQRVSRYLGTSRGRITKPPFETAVASLKIFDGPSYTSSGILEAGGKRSSATLGPHALISVNSDANSSLPSYIVAARKKYPDSYLKAGRLLNAQFGGDGNDANNLTILSASGNANHRAFDNKVVEAITSLRKAYYVLWQDDIDIINVLVGIEVVISVSIDEPWDGETQIFSKLSCGARVGQWSTIPQEMEDDKLRNEFISYMNEVVDLCNEANSNGTITNEP